MSFHLPNQIARAFQKLKQIYFHKCFINRHMQRDWTVLLHSCFHISFCCFIFLFYLTKDPMPSNVLVILLSFSMNILLYQKAKAKTKMWHRNEPGRKQYEELYQVKTEKHYLRKWLPSID